VPVVLVNSRGEQAGRYTFSISVDNRHGAHMATEHLVQLGHRRIAYVAGPANHSDDLERQAGYRQALSEAGLHRGPGLVIPGTGRAGGGERALHAMLGLEDPPTAAVCYNDMTAVGLLREARQMGLLIPRDLAVVGFDDVPIASYVCPPLTTIAQPTADMGRRAMQMVLALLERNGHGAGAISDVTVQGTLVVRESSGARLRPVDNTSLRQLEVRL
jgi:LacI family repressor for deo operon, udp, cdd, tsx, nupC, and nupG